MRRSSSTTFGQTESLCLAWDYVQAKVTPSGQSFLSADFHVRAPGEGFREDADVEVRVEEE